MWWAGAWNANKPWFVVARNGPDRNRCKVLDWSQHLELAHVRFEIDHETRLKSRAGRGTYAWLLGTVTPTPISESAVRVTWSRGDGWFADEEGRPVLGGSAAHCLVAGGRPVLLIDNPSTYEPGHVARLPVPC